MHMQMFWEKKFQKFYWKIFKFTIRIIVQQEFRACIKIPSVQLQWNFTQQSSRNSDTQNHNSGGESG